MTLLIPPLIAEFLAKALFCLFFHWVFFMVLKILYV